VQIGVACSPWRRLYPHGEVRMEETHDAKG
jgi:hypothetical protein